MTFSAAKMTVKLILDGHSDMLAIFKTIKESKLELEREKVNGSSTILDHDQNDFFL